MNPEYGCHASISSCRLQYLEKACQKSAAPKSAAHKKFCLVVIETKKGIYFRKYLLAKLILSDSDRIQTCNLLIRSQMLYSVELRSHISELRVQR